MKHIAGVIGLFGAFALTSFARAGNLDLEIHCVPRKVSEKANSGSGPGGMSATRENWVYAVTIENKTFRDLANLEVKYVIFFEQEHLGSKQTAKPIRQTGALTLPLLRSHEKKTFTTDAVALTTANLIGQYHFLSGAKIKTQDRLSGLWTRVYQNGQQFAEYANPSTLTQEKWE